MGPAPLPAQGGPVEKLLLGAWLAPWGCSIGSGVSGQGLPELGA